MTFNARFIGVQWVMVHALLLAQVMSEPPAMFRDAQVVIGNMSRRLGAKHGACLIIQSVHMVTAMPRAVYVLIMEEAAPLHCLEVDLLA